MQLLDRVLVKLGHGLGLPPRYKPLKKIGAGAEGEVWLGVDEETQIMVALKFIPRGAPAWKLDMARREFSMLAQLGAGHLNIVRALEVVLTTKHLVLVTEYVPGGSLSDHLARHAVCEEVACYHFKQLLDAISFCHTRKIVYRDIKPANMLITGTQPPFLKLCDFGLADSWEGRPGPCFKSLVGTPGYMAPEIMSSFFTGAAELARRSRDAALARRSKDAAKHQQATPAIKSQQPSQQPPAGAAAVAAATATRTLKPCSSGIAAATADKAGKKGAELPSSSTSGMKRTGSSSSLKRSASATALAELAAAASKAAAAVPGGSNISRSLAAVAAAVGLPDAAAEAELEVVPTYDGEKADVYSLGVLLVVMLLRHMPWNYDSYADRLPVLKAMKALYDTAVVHKVSWRTATSRANTLSPQLAAMLDGMLEPNPDKRYTLQQVAECEWLRLPLPSKLQCALDVIAEQQKLREARYIGALADAAEASGSSRCCPDAAAAAAVKQQLDDMIETAQTVGKGYKLVSRLVLSEIPQRRYQQQQKPQGEQEQRVEVQDSASEYCTAAIITAQVPGEGQAVGDGKGGVAAAAVDVSVKVA